MEKMNKLEIIAEEEDSGRLIRKAGYAYITIGIIASGIVGYVTRDPVTAILAGSVGTSFGLITTYIGRKISN